MCLVAAIAIAFGLNFFLKTGPWRAFGYSLFAICIFLFFAASGMWADAARHDWGVLTPVFALMLVGGFVFLKFGKRIWLFWQKKEQEFKDKDDSPF